MTERLPRLRPHFRAARRGPPPPDLGAVLPGRLPAHAHPGRADRARRRTRGAGSPPLRAGRGRRPGDGPLPGRADRGALRHPLHGLAPERAALPGDAPRRRRHVLLQPLGLGRPVRPRAAVRGRGPDSAVSRGGRALRADASRRLRRRSRHRHRHRIRSRRTGLPRRPPRRIHLRDHRTPGGRLRRRRRNQPRHPGGLDPPRVQPARASRRPAAGPDRTRKTPGTP